LQQSGRCQALGLDAMLHHDPGIMPDRPAAVL
jgi:hypothetical protein